MMIGLKILQEPVVLKILLEPVMFRMCFSLYVIWY